MQLLAASTPDEPHFAPGDTARHGVGVVHKTFDGTDTLGIATTESADTLEIGGPCG